MSSRSEINDAKSNTSQMTYASRMRKNQDYAQQNKKDKKNYFESIEKTYLPRDRLGEKKFRTNVPSEREDKKSNFNSSMESPMQSKGSIEDKSVKSQMIPRKGLIRFKEKSKKLFQDDDPLRRS